MSGICSENGGLSLSSLVSVKSVLVYALLLWSIRCVFKSYVALGSRWKASCCSTLAGSFPVWRSGVNQGLSQGGTAPIFCSSLHHTNTVSPFLSLFAISFFLSLSSLFLCRGRYPSLFQLSPRFFFNSISSFIFSLDPSLLIFFNFV